MTKPIFDMADARNNRDKIGQINPMQRFGVASEIASVAYFLAFVFSLFLLEALKTASPNLCVRDECRSPAASYINGQAIAVDGGLSSSLPVAFKKSGKVSL